MISFTPQFVYLKLLQLLKLFEYKRKENAQKLCDDINSRQSVKFIVKEIGDENNE